MANKFGRNNGDCLYWIYPFIILVILILVILRDKQNRESAGLPDADIIPDSSITLNIHSRMADSLGLIKLNDSTPKLYATTE